MEKVVTAAARHWYLVYCKPRREVAAEHNLMRQGYEVYLPRVRQRRRRGGQRVTVVEPLFPRYLFIRLDSHTDNWGPIRSTIGVAGIVRFGQQPAKVPNAFIGTLRLHETPDGIHELELGALKPGERVRITDGVLTGYEGIFLAANSRDRVVVLLEIMGKPTHASLPVDSLEAAH